jgi:hypothetical protein
MAEETTPTTPAPESGPVEVTDKPVTPAEAAPVESAKVATIPVEQPAAAVETPEAPATAQARPAEPDAIQPYVDKVNENIKLALEGPDIGKFLRAHIKTFREEWDGWSDNAKYTYTHMMTAQLLQRQAAATQIAMGNQFKLPNPSAQTQLMNSIQRALTKPPKGRPALSVPFKLRPTSSQK